MKRIYLYAGILIALLIITISYGNQIHIRKSNQQLSMEETESLPERTVETKTFSSISEYLLFAKEAGQDSIHLYVPRDLPEGFSLLEIANTKDVYLTSRYSLGEKTETYEQERLQTLICKHSLLGRGKDLLQTYIKNGYEPFEYNGKTYYRFDEYSLSNNDLLLGYEIVFLEDDGNDLIFMHLPAIDSFENMIQYAEIDRIVTCSGFDCENEA